MKTLNALIIVIFLSLNIYGQNWGNIINTQLNPNYPLEIANGGEKFSIFSNSPLIQALLSGFNDNYSISLPLFLTNQLPIAMH